MPGVASGDRPGRRPAGDPAPELATEAEVARVAAGFHLDLLGGFATEPADGLPEEVATVLLFGALEPGFWDYLASCPEGRDQQPNPVDRWSRRALDGLARAIHPDARPRFPFGGPPHDPFPAWALRSGRCRISPVGLLVHDRCGLMVSFRGALWLPGAVALSSPLPPPCEGCAAPCKDACPIGALTPAGYDVPACRSWLAGAEGHACMSEGCAVRRACPVGRDRSPSAARARHHMRSFL